MADEQCVSALEDQYPRIVQNVVAVWKDAEGAKYFDKLVLDTRAGENNARQGFPPEVLEELLFLSSVHMTIFPVEPDLGRDFRWK